MRTFRSCSIAFGLAISALAATTAAAQTPVPKLAPKVTVPDMTRDLILANVSHANCSRMLVTVRNQGNLAVTGPVLVRISAIYLGGETSTVHEATVNGLPAFGNAVLTFDNVGSADSGYIIEVDPSNLVAESSENNTWIVSNQESGGCPVASIPVQYSNSTTTVTEGGVIRFPVQLAHPFPGEVRVSYSTEDGTAQGMAFSKVLDPRDCRGDYVTRQGTLVFAAGTTNLTQYVDVQTCRDGRAEGQETVLLRLHDPVNAVISSSLYRYRPGRISNSSP